MPYPTDVELVDQAIEIRIVEMCIVIDEELPDLLGKTHRINCRPYPFHVLDPEMERCRGR